MATLGLGRAPIPLLAAALFLFAAAVWPSALRGLPAFPTLSGRIVDQAALIDSATQSEIEAKLAAFEKRTNIQLVVVTLRSLGGYDIADYGYQLGRHWGIGQKGEDNGAILIIAQNERRVRIEVGYGLEGTLTDAVSRLIIENAIAPRFRAGDFSGGIRRGVDDIVQVLSGDAEAFKARAAEREGPGGKEGLSSFLVVALILGFWFLSFLRAGPRGFGRRRSGWWIPMGGGGWPLGGSSRSGRFSGGGGSFGGGGASGSW